MLSRDNCRIYLKVIIIVLISRKVRILRLIVVQVNEFYGIQEEWHPVPWLCPILRGVRVHSRPLGRAINNGYKRGKYDFKKRDADDTTPCMGKDLGEGPGNASSSSGSYRLKLAWHELIDVSPFCWILRVSSRSSFQRYSIDIPQWNANGNPNRWRELPNRYICTSIVLWHRYMKRFSLDRFYISCKPIASLLRQPIWSLHFEINASYLIG